MKLRLTVVENAHDCLTDATELYAEVDWTIEALGKQIRLVDTCLHRGCIICGKGQYVDIVDCNTAAQHNFGLAVMGQPKFKKSAPLIMDDPISITLIYLYSEAALDVDNVIKPIQDALIGLVYFDDSLVTAVIIRRRELGGTFDLSRVSSVLIDGFEYGDEFVYVHIANPNVAEVLGRSGLEVGRDGRHCWYC